MTTIILVGQNLLELCLLSLILDLPDRPNPSLFLKFLYPFRAVVGSKSLNLAKLRPSLPSEIVTPRAVALPYGCFQKTLAHPDNKDRVLEPLTGCLSRLRPDTPNAEAQKIFSEGRELLSRLVFPLDFQKELIRRMEESGRDGLLKLYEKWGARAAWKSICEVWASLFGLRPWVSYQ